MHTWREVLTWPGISSYKSFTLDKSGCVEEYIARHPQLIPRVILEDMHTILSIARLSDIGPKAPLNDVSYHLLGPSFWLAQLAWAAWVQQPWPQFSHEEIELLLGLFRWGGDTERANALLESLQHASA